MQRIWRRRVRGAAMATGLGLTMVAAGPSISAHDDDGQARIVGAWAVQVTLRNCDTAAPVGSFLSLVTFQLGGTMSESSGNASLRIGQRSEGHGAWRPLGGRMFSQRTIGLIRFTSAPNLPGTPTFDPSQPISPGFSAGWQTITQQVKLTGPDSFESAGTTEFFDTAGLSYRTGCATAVGQRFR